MFLKVSTLLQSLFQQCALYEVHLLEQINRVQNLPTAMSSYRALCTPSMNKTTIPEQKTTTASHATAKDEQTGGRQGRGDARNVVQIKTSSWLTKPGMCSIRGRASFTKVSTCVNGISGFQDFMKATEFDPNCIHVDQIWLISIHGQRDMNCTHGQQIHKAGACSYLWMESQKGTPLPEKCHIPTRYLYPH